MHTHRQFHPVYMYVYISGFFFVASTRLGWFTYFTVFCSSSSMLSNMHWLSLLRNVNIITSPSCCQHSAAKRAKENSTLSNAIIRGNWSKLIRKLELVAPECAPLTTAKFLFSSSVGLLYLFIHRAVSNEKGTVYDEMCPHWFFHHFIHVMFATLANLYIMYII